MPFFNTKLAGLVANTTIYGLIGFMYHTNTASKKNSKDIECSTMVISSQFFSLKDCTKRIQDECTRCDQELKKIKEILLDVKSIQSFNQIDLVEMREVCQMLLNTFLLLANLNEKVLDEKKLFQENVVDTVNKFDFNRKLYGYKYRAMGGFLSGILTGSATDNIILFALGIAGGVGITHLGMYCTSYPNSRPKIQFNSTFVDNNKIKELVGDSRDKTETIVNRLLEQFELIFKNKRTATESGSQVKNRVDKMLADVYFLRNAVYEMKRKSQFNENIVKKIMNL